eukprot:3227126-Prymnesium_polylepis.1
MTASERRRAGARRAWSYSRHSAWPRACADSRTVDRSRGRWAPPQRCGTLECGGARTAQIGVCSLYEGRQMCRRPLRPSVM